MARSHFSASAKFKTYSSFEGLSARTSKVSTEQSASSYFQPPLKEVFVEPCCTLADGVESFGLRKVPTFTFRESFGCSHREVRTVPCWLVLVIITVTPRLGWPGQKKELHLLKNSSCSENGLVATPKTDEEGETSFHKKGT